MRIINYILAAIFVVAVTFTMAWPRSTACAADPAFQLSAGERQLFLDDVGIANVENLKRTMHPPEKKGAVIKPDPKLGERSLQTRSAPQWDPEAKRYRFWNCSEPDDMNARGVYASGYFESEDGIHWRRPVMRQIEHRGSLKNNYVNVKETGRRMYLTLRDPTDPEPSRRYKGFSFTSGGLQPLVSDGVTWKRLDAPPVRSMDEFNLSYDAAQQRYLLSVKCAGPYGRAFALSTSKDFEHWTRPELIFHADKTDQERARQIIKERFTNPTVQRPVYNQPSGYGAQIYNFAVFRYEGLYIGLPAVYYRTGPCAGGGDDGFHHVQLACSRDLKRWQRLGDRKPFIGPSPLGGDAYDLQQIIGPSYPIVREDELWFYYTGLKFRCVPKGMRPDGPDRAAICLAVLRRDGFISLDATDTEGIVQTKPFTVPSGKLHINVDAPKGKLRVEVLNGAGQVVAQSELLGGDLLSEPVKWAEGDIAKMKDKNVSLRFTLSNAEFYSYWLE